MARVIVAFLGRIARSGPALPLRLALRRMVGRSAYDRFRVAVWTRARKVEAVDPLHRDILPMIDRLESSGRLAVGAAGRLREVALGIRAEARRDARE